MKAIWFGQHLYGTTPLFRPEDRRYQPGSLNKGERRFVEDLKKFHDAGFLAGKELYLLRNQSKGRGVGFFEANNFHPDFILWLLTEGCQVDPKGIRNVAATDPKIQFYETIKEIEQRMGALNVRLDSFIISGTPSHTMQMMWNLDKAAMKQRYILFQEEDQETYIGEMFKTVIPG